MYYKNLTHVNEKQVERRKSAILQIDIDISELQREKNRTDVVFTDSIAKMTESLATNMETATAQI